MLQHLRRVTKTSKAYLRQIVLLSLESCQLLLTSLGQIPPKNSRAAEAAAAFSSHSRSEMELSIIVSCHQNWTIVRRLTPKGGQCHTSLFKLDSTVTV